MLKQLDLTFDYEKPNVTRRGRMRTPVTIYLHGSKQTGGILYIAQSWLDNNKINGNEIAMQVKGTVDTYIIFNPQNNAPRFAARASSPKKGSVAYSCTEAVRKIIEIFCPNQTHHELWLERVGTFHDSIVCRLRNVNENDTIYHF